MINLFDYKRFHLNRIKQRAISCIQAFYYDTMLCSFSRLGGGL